MNTKQRWRVTALVMAAVLVATSLSLLPRPAPVAAQQAAAPEEPAPLAKPLGKPVVEPVRGFVEGKSTEDRSLWTASSRTWRNPDNTLTSRVYGGVVNFPSGPGQWSPIDSTLVAGDGEYRNAAGPYSVRFSRTSNSKALVTFADGDASISLGPPHGAAPDVTPVVNGTEITYPALLPGIDLRYDLGRFVLKEDLIMKERPRAGASLRFSFPVSFSNVTPTSRPDGGMDLVNAEGRAIFTLPAGYMADSNAGRSEPKHRGRVDLSLSHRPEGPTLDLVPDMAWLADPAREYPVYVDPTIQTHGNTCVWHGCQGTSADVYVAQGAPDWTANHSYVDFLGRWDDAVGGEDGPNERVSYLHYDATVFRHSDIYWGHWQGYWMWKECAGDSWHWIWPTGGAWSNGAGAPDPWMPGITWNRRLWYGDGWHAGDQGVIAVATGTGWNRWDITGWVRPWASGAWANRGIQIDTQGSGNCRFRRLAAHENGDGSDSYLEVDHYDPPPDTPGLVSPGHGANLTSTPTLTGHYSDRNGEPGYINFQVENANTGAVVAGGTVPACSWCNASWTPPALGDGNYRWRAYAYDDTSASWWSGYWYFNIDATAPAPPSVSASPHESSSSWYANNTPTFSWSAGDTSGICDYAHTMDQTSGADPGYASTGTANRYTSPARADGVWYFHIRAKNCAGVWGSPAQVRVNIDTTPSPPPAVSVSPHEKAEVWYSNAAPVVSWSARDTSDITGYSYTLDQDSAATTADDTSEGTGTTTSFSGLPDGVNYFRIKARNGANLWSATTRREIRVDTTAPTEPTTVESSSHAPGTSSNTRSIAVAWSGASDATSGIKDYVWAFKPSSTTPADPATDPRTTGTTATSGSLDDGTWWFHVRSVDNAGNVSPDRAYGPFVIDGTGPAAPTISSTSHTQDDWDVDRTAVFTWNAPADASPIEGYRVAFDGSSITDPGETDASTAVGTWTETNVGDGEHWLHVRAKDAAGNLGATGHYRIRVDATPPEAPVVSSSEHADEAQVYESNDPALEWSEPVDVSGVTDYSYVLDSDATTVPDTVAETTTRSVSYGDLPDGEYWFHVRARNGSGLWGDTDHFRIRISLLVNAENGLDSDNTGPGESITTPPAPALPDVVPAPPGGLPELFPTDNLVGPDPLFGGDFLPDDDPADAVRDAFGSLLPPTPKAPDLGPVLRQGLGTLRDLPKIPSVFQLFNAATYQVTTTRYEPDGSTTSRTDSFASCVPTSYSSRDGAAGLDPDLRIDLCPDPSSFQGSTQKLAYTLDALKPGVRVKVTATFLALDKRLELTTEARTKDHPATFRGDLTAGPGADADQTNVIETASSHPLEALDLRLSRLSGATYVAEGRTRIEAIPASASHRYTLYAQGATSSRRTVAARIALADGTANPGEFLLLEQFDPANGGRLVGRLRFSQIPSSFDTRLDVTLAPEGSVDSAAPLKLKLTGTQPVAPSQTLVIEQWAGSRLLGLLNVGSFASSYIYEAEAVRNADAQEVGARFTAVFPAGIPADGRFQLARYRYNGNTQQDELDSLADFGGFSESTSFDGRVEGSATDPSGEKLTLNVRNAAAVPAQLLQVVQYPSGKDPTRLVLAGGAAPVGRISSTVAGKNLTWDKIPKDFDLSVLVKQQANGVPSKLAISGWNGDAPLAGRLELTGRTSEGTAGLVVKALTHNHSLDIDFDGDYQEVRRARVARDNGGSRPEQALQLYFTDAQGLRTQVTVKGSGASSEGLVPGSGRELNGVITAVPDRFSFGVAATTTSIQSGTATEATISGDGSTAAPDMAVHIADTRRGLELHQRSFPVSYTFTVGAQLDSAGHIKSAHLRGAQSAANPTGRFDLAYSGIRALLQSVAASFSYDLVVDGPLDNPISLSIRQRQSEANPGLIMQLVRYAGASPRAAVTLRNAADGTAPLPENATVLDALWKGIPKDFDLLYGRRAGMSSESISVNADFFGEDLPDATIRVRRYEGADRQEVHLRGLAPSWLASIDAEGDAQDPDELRADLATTVRHPNDAVQLLNYRTGVLTHNLHFTAPSATAPVAGTGSDVEASYTNLPEAVVLRYGRLQDQGRDKSYRLQMTNEAVGAALTDRVATANPAGKVRFELKAGTEASEFLDADDLPGRFDLSFERPAKDPGASGNCLGNINYTGSESTLDLSLALFPDNTCLPPSPAGTKGTGDVTASITDLPSHGFAHAELLPDGTARFQTRVADGAQQRVGMIRLETPAPIGVRRFLNKDISIPETGEGSKALCPAWGYGFANNENRRVVCIDANIRATPEFVDIGLLVIAHQLSSAELRTNFDDAGMPKPFPGGDNVDEVLWQNLPLFGVRYTGGGELTAEVTGTDDTTEAGNGLSQEVSCCVGPIRARHSQSISFDGQPLRVRFYGWVVDAQGRKFNRQGQELRNSFGSYIRTHTPGVGDMDPVPFDPTFIMGPVGENKLKVLPGETAYFVPNPYDALLSQVPDITNDDKPPDVLSPERGRWHAKNVFNTWQTDWYFQSLLHEMEPDALRFNG